MRVLVAGSSGFIGRALVTALRAGGDEVIAIARTSGNPEKVYLDIDRARLVDANGADGLVGVDAVVNLAGEPITLGRWSAAKRERIRASRIAVTAALAESIARAENPPSVFVSGSAAGYYGSRGDELLAEASRPGTGMLAEVCRGWEAATDAARAAGVRTVVVRTGLVLGDGGLLAKTSWIFRLGLGAQLGSGRQWMSWISLADEIGAIRHLIATESAEGAFNLAAPAPVTNARFTAELAHALGRRANFTVPRAALVCALGAENANELALASQRLGTERLSDSGFMFRVDDLAVALADAAQ